MEGFWLGKEINRTLLEFDIWYSIIWIDGRCYIKW